MKSECFINTLIGASAVFDGSMTSADCCRLTHACAMACRGVPLPLQQEVREVLQKGRA